MFDVKRKINAMPSPEREAFINEAKKRYPNDDETFSLLVDKIDEYEEKFISSFLNKLYDDDPYLAYMALKKEHYKILKLMFPKRRLPIE